MVFDFRYVQKSSGSDIDISRFARSFVIELKMLQIKLSE